MSKENQKAQDRYHDKMTMLRIRFPSKEACGIDYTELIRAKAVEYNLINKRGEGSVNAYILKLIEEDLGITMMKGMEEVAHKTEE